MMRYEVIELGGLTVAICPLCGVLVFSSRDHDSWHEANDGIPDRYLAAPTHEGEALPPDVQAGDVWQGRPLTAAEAVPGGTPERRRHTLDEPDGRSR